MEKGKKPMEDRESINKDNENKNNSEYFPIFSFEIEFSCSL